MKKTGRLLVVDEAYAMCGVGAEIAAIVMEEAFDELDAPVGRLHTEPVSHPFSPILEDAVTASAEKIVAAARAVIDGRPPHQLRAVGSVPKAACTGFRRQRQRSAIAAVQRLRRQHAGSGSCCTGRAAPAAAPRGKSVETAACRSIMPNMDLIITEATIVAWFKKVGETVGKGEALLEIETDKAVTQVESPADGVLAEILADAGAVVPLGQQLGTIAP